MQEPNLEELREQLDEVNIEVLKWINKRGELVKKIGEIKKAQGIKVFDPVREREMLNHIVDHHEGPFESSTIEHLFKEIFKAAKELQEDDYRKTLLVSREQKPQDTIVSVEDVEIGGGNLQYIIGPCSVEQKNRSIKSRKL